MGKNRKLTIYPATADSSAQIHLIRRWEYGARLADSKRMTWGLLRRFSQSGHRQSTPI
jgi:hypothetical protein